MACRLRAERPPRAHHPLLRVTTHAGRSASRGVLIIHLLPKHQLTFANPMNDVQHMCMQVCRCSAMEVMVSGTRVAVDAAHVQQSRLLTSLQCNADISQRNLPVALDAFRQ